jgi:hypothetical protein
LSADQNKPPGDNLLGKTPKKADAKLPGPLAGLGGGAKPAPLPGLGGKKVGAPLPGLGGPAPKPVVPPFMQQAEPAAPAGPSKEQVARDPFGADSLPSQRSSYIPPDQGLIGGVDQGPAFSAAQAGKTKKPLILGGALIAIICILIGFMGGTSVKGRVALNIAIRDALIVEYELKKSADLFEEVEGMINSALADTMKRKFSKNHLDFLGANVQGNPVNARIFTERNYKNFDVAAVQWLNTYFNKWGELAALIDDHRRETKNDEKQLAAAGEEFKKLLTTQYGVVFAREEKAGNQLVADLVVLGACAEDKDLMKCQVQVDTGTFGDARVLYSSEPGDGELTKEPELYVMPVGDHSKAGILKNATQSHFNKYVTRLKAMSDLMKVIRETQTNLIGKIGEICSQEPVGFLGGIDVEDEVAEYIKNEESRVDEVAPAE